jgi:hypothetical protein
MKIGTEDKKKLRIFAVVGTLGLGAAVYIYMQLFTTSTPVQAPVNAPAAARPQAPVAVRTGTAKRTEVALDLDPTLKMGPMRVTESLVYSGNGRNIFSASSAPEVMIQKPIAPARPVAPPPPVYVAPTGPPPPPPIDLKFFGTATAGNGKRQAFLLHGEDVFLASEGDIVQRRYRVVSMTANSIVVRDLTNNNQQTLPLIVR